ncbi:hypothetical protein [Mycolicibacterium vanbaalenii]|uniref:hypothetical protein n=1 Tax=Mycolicibacterium vanbaalenii TaxID=110539 RepID=UPI00132FCB39|nr:hypothetical protein [Mycolicibacterium vanbaalenii]
MEERRELFNRRYQRPAPPEGMSPVKSIRDYQKGTADVRLSSESDHRRDDQIAA